MSLPPAPGTPPTVTLTIDLRKVIDVDRIGAGGGLSSFASRVDRQSNSDD